MNAKMFDKSQNVKCTLLGFYKYFTVPTHCVNCQGKLLSDCVDPSYQVILDKSTSSKMVGVGALCGQVVGGGGCLMWAGCAFVIGVASEPGARCARVRLVPPPPHPFPNPFPPPPPPPNFLQCGFSTGRSGAISLLRFFFVCASVVS